MDLETVIQSEIVRKRRTNIVNTIHTHMWNLDKLYKESYLQSRNSPICGEQIYDYQGGERGWDELELTYIYYHI